MLTSRIVRNGNKISYNYGAFDLSLEDSWLALEKRSDPDYETNPDRSEICMDMEIVWDNPGYFRGKRYSTDVDPLMITSRQFSVYLVLDENNDVILVELRIFSRMIERQSQRVDLNLIYQDRITKPGDKMSLSAGQGLGRETLKSSLYYLLRSIPLVSSEQEAQEFVDAFFSR